MPSIPVALQMYSIRHTWSDQPAQTLKRVADMGYDAVEFYGADYARSAAELRKMLDDLGLVCCGAHTDFARFADDKIKATIEFNLTLGNRFIIVPGIPEQLRKTRDDWLKRAEQFNAWADRLKPYGCLTGYHNHNVEFTPLDGELPWDTFFGNTRNEVIMQFDTGNALRAKAEATPFIARYPGRALSVHIKDYSAKTGEDTIAGEGDIDFDQLLPLCESVGGVQWYVIEHENQNVDAMQAAADCLTSFRKIQERLAAGQR